MKRYSVNVQYRTGQERMLETEGGQWVRHSDVATLTTENAALAVERDQILNNAIAIETELTELKAQLAAAEPVALPECLDRLFTYAHAMTFGEDWNSGTHAGKHRANLIAAVQDCVAYEQAHSLRVAPPQHAADKPWIALAATMYQAAGAFGMPVRVLDLLSTAQSGEPFGHLIDGVLPVMPEQHAARVPEWQPIEAAPRDGSRIWAINSVMREPVIAAWGDYTTLAGFKTKAFVVTHDPHERFMPTTGNMVCPDKWAPLLAAPTPPAQENQS